MLMDVNGSYKLTKPTGGPHPVFSLVQPNQLVTGTALPSNRGVRDMGYPRDGL